STDEGWFVSWAPNGREIAFVRDKGIWVVGSDGSGEREVDGEEYPVWSPAWAPDGRWIAFGIDDGNASLAVIHLDESSKKAMGIGLRDAEWSPDSRTLVAERRPSVSGESSGLVVTNLITGAATQLTTASDWYPGWSPDGSKVAFVRRMDAGSTARWALMIAAADGSDVKELSPM